MRLVLPLALSCCLVAGHVSATGGISCATAEGDGSFDLTVGSLDVLHVQQARISANGQAWSTGEGEATPISVGQAFETDDRMWIDFTDPNVERVMIEIRLSKAFEGKHAAMAGTLRIAGEGAWAVTCVGP